MERKDKILWMTTLAALCLAAYSIFRPPGVRPNTAEAAEPSSQQEVVSHDHGNSSTRGGDTTKVSGHSDDPGSLPYFELTQEEQERVALEEMATAQSRFDAAFESDRLDEPSDWSIGTENAFLDYVDTIAATVSKAECGNAICRASIEFETDEDSKEFFSFRERKKQNPWGTGRLKAVPVDLTYRRYLVYAIPDPVRKSSWGLLDEKHERPVSR